MKPFCLLSRSARGLNDQRLRGKAARHETHLGPESWTGRSHLTGTGHCKSPQTLQTTAVRGRSSAGTADWTSGCSRETAAQRSWSGGCCLPPQVLLSLRACMHM